MANWFATKNKKRVEWFMQKVKRVLNMHQATSSGVAGGPPTARKLFQSCQSCGELAKSSRSRIQTFYLSFCKGEILSVSEAWCTEIAWLVLRRMRRWRQRHFGCLCFHGKSLLSLRSLWRNKIYAIEGVTRLWTDNGTDPKTRHTIKVCFSTKPPTWGKMGLLTADDNAFKSYLTEQLLAPRKYYFHLPLT